MFLISRAVLVVVMGSCYGGANKLLTGSDLTGYLSCLGTQPTYLHHLPWSPIRAYSPNTTPRKMAT